MPALFRLFAAFALLLLALPASAQSAPVFDPDDLIGTKANVSGDDDCGLDPGAHCTAKWAKISAELGQSDEMLSSLTFGYSGGSACSVTSPRPVDGLQVTPNRRSWNECPDGRANRTHRLSTTALPGPDYGLNRIRICTGSDGLMQGVEARFFKHPHLSRHASGQEVVTRTFERNRCQTWQSWSTCPAGKSAGGLHIYSQTGNSGHVEGLALHCHRVLAPPTLRPRN